MISYEPVRLELKEGLTEVTVINENGEEETLVSTRLPHKDLFDAMSGLAGIFCRHMEIPDEMKGRVHARGLRKKETKDASGFIIMASINSSLNMEAASKSISRRSSAWARSSSGISSSRTTSPPSPSFANNFAAVAFKVKRLHRHKVNNTLQTIFQTNGNLHHHRVQIQLFPQLIGDAERIGAGAVAFVDKRNAGNVVPFHLTVNSN